MATAVKLAGPGHDAKAGYEPAPASPQVSTDSSLSHMTPMNEATASNKDHSKWNEDEWVWNSVGMVAEPLPGGSDGGDKSPKPQVSSSQEKHVKPAPRQSESGVSSHFGSEPGLTVESSGQSCSAPRGPPVCQVDDCSADLTELRTYNQRYKVCQSCIKNPDVTVKGKSVRFCQQCSCFHDLSAFDGKKRSCREQLEKHNKRRRERMEAAAVKASQAGASDVLVADSTAGFSGKRTRLMTPMDSVSSDFEIGSGAGMLQHTVSGLASAFQGQSSITTGHHGLTGKNVEMESFVKSLQSTINAPSWDMETGALGQALPPNTEMSSPFELQGLSALGAPSSGDMGVLRQLAPSNTYFVMPRAPEPILSGPSTTPDFDVRLASFQVQLSAPSQSPVTSGANPASNSEFGYTEAPDLASAGKVDSFKAWADKALGDSFKEKLKPSNLSAPQLNLNPGQPALEQWDSMDKFWDSFAFEPEAPAENFSSGTPAVQSKDVKNGTADLVQNGNLHNVLSVPEDVLEDALNLLNEPVSTAYTPQPDKLVRMSFKMFDRFPSDLTPDVREKINNITASGASAHSSYLQQGCTHLMVDMLVPDAEALSGPSALSQTLASGLLAKTLPARHFLSGKGVVQGPDGTAVRIEGGRVVDMASSSAAAPVLLGADTNVVCNNIDMSCIKLFLVHDLAAGPVTGLSVAVRHAGNYIDALIEGTSILGSAPTYSPTASLVRMTVMVPAGNLTEGLLTMEVTRGNGLMSLPLPLVVTNSTVIMKELSQLGPARPLSQGLDSLNDLNASLVADLGLVLDYQASADTARGNAAKAAGVSVSAIARRGRALLLVAAERGWTGVTAAMLDAAAADCPNANEAVALVNSIRGPNSSGLLIAAIRGGNPVLLSMILDWVNEEGSGIPLDIMSPHSGVSPLHVSAAYSDSGIMAELLLQHAAPNDPEAQYAMWSDPNGRRISPEGIANKCRRNSTQTRMVLKRPIHEEEDLGVPMQDGRDPFEEPTEDELPPPPKPASGGNVILAKARKTWNSFKKRLERERAQQKAAALQEGEGTSQAPAKLDRFDSATSWGPSLPSTPVSAVVPMHAEYEVEGTDGSFVAALPKMPKNVEAQVPRTDSAREEAAPTRFKGTPDSGLGNIDNERMQVDSALEAKARLAQQGLPGPRRVSDTASQ